MHERKNLESQINLLMYGNKILYLTIFFFFNQCSILQKNLFCMQSLFFLSPACNEESFQTTKRPTE